MHHFNDNEFRAEMLKVPNIMQKVSVIFGTFRKKPYLCIRNKKQTLFINIKPQASHLTKTGKDYEDNKVFQRD
jgi:hypothetical protein